MQISPYEQGNIFNKDPLRPKRLLVHKREITKMLSIVKQKNHTIIPLSVYFKGSRVKVSIGLCKGKKLYDKRQDVAERDAKRVADRAVKNFFK
jgi:SsrA-binding protein